VTPPLFLLDPLPDGDSLVLAGEEGRHAARVRRIGPGEAVLVSDGRGHVAECLVSAAQQDRLELAVLARRTLAPPSPRLVVVQALAKGDRAELAVELLTELGADEIVPWAAARSITQWRDERGAKALLRWRSTAREATKQSRRAWVPTVAECAGTAAIVALLETAPGLVLHEQASDSLARCELPEDGSLVLVVGPEGGITPEELAAFIAAGARPARLGDQVLRTSTAGAAALAALSVRLGRWA
jgi:16S rRNA (uracil1498-N3)-methyltransferase